MSLVSTPGQLASQSEFYRQLGSMAQAGIGVVPGLEQLSQRPPSRATGRMARELLTHLSAGKTLAEALRTLREPPPIFDLALLEAGEQSGRLDGCLKLLAEHYENRVKMARQMISDLMYPAFLLHAAVFIFPFANFFLSGNLFLYLAQTLGLLIPLYLAVFAVVYACQGRHGEAWRATLERFTRCIPLLGTARKNLALSRLAAALEALISAGVPIFHALELAADACGSPALRREIHAWKPRLTTGATPGELIRTSPEFPQLFSGLYSGGEVSGKLDQELRHLHVLYYEQGTQQMKNISAWVPKIIYLGIMLVIAFKVISFYQGYFNEINKLTQ